MVFARDALGLSKSVVLKFSPLEGRGSDRAFFRLKWSRKKSAILVRYDPKRIENGYYAEIAVFLRDHDIPVPRLIGHDPTRHLIIMEDLGNTDLWSLRKAPWKTRQALYQEALIIVQRLHSIPEKDFPGGRVRLMEGFGPALYRWERDYFRDHFVGDFCGIKLEPPFSRKLEAELSKLANRLSKTKRCLVHRDLQSQNVMIRDGKPFLIDFQGMRLGSPLYDLGSLLCDPYADLSETGRVELLSFYYGLAPWGFDWATFQTVFWEASTQRLMQALGAYGFLGISQGLRAYLEHIPSGLRMLHQAVQHVATLPRLHDLSQACQSVIEQKKGG